MEMYTNASDRTVKLDLPITATSIDVTVHEGTELIYTVPTVGIADGTYSFDLPFSLTQQNHNYRVHWNIIHTENLAPTEFDYDSYVHVVTPLVSVSTAREELEIPASFSDDAIVRTERRVRAIIEGVTGQVFARRSATLPAVQFPDGSLRLPERMLSLTSVGGVATSLYYVLANGGWSLAIVYPRKRDGIRAGEVPISDPFSKWRATGVEKVQVTGVWGYADVPVDIQEAALILIEQKLCPEALYQERYLKTMTAADFRFEFDPDAYRGTGNVVADQILAKYINYNIALV